MDVETTGLDFDAESVIEVAAARFENGSAAGVFEARLNPGKPLTAMARLLTGLDEASLRDAPPAAGTWRAFLDFVGDSALVAHNADFDSTFVTRALEREGLPPPAGPWLDSLILARAAWPEWESHRLESLAARLGLPEDGAHRALPDARRAGQLFLEAQKVLRASASPQTWEWLRNLAADLAGWGRVFGERPESEFTGAAKSAFESPASPSDAADENAAQSAAGLLAASRWLALETPPPVDDVETGYAAALAAASRGLRVLLAVPDGQAWNKLRRRAAGAPSPVVAALEEPQGFLCRRRFEALVADPARRLPPEERLQALPLAAWAGSFASGRIADCRGFSPDRARLLWSRVCCDTYEEDDAARKAKADADKADIILTTQACLFAHLKLEGALLPACDALIVCGAHRFAEEAQIQMGRKLTFFRLRGVLQMLRYSGERLFGILPALDASLGAVPEPAEPEKALHRFLQKIGKAAAKRRNAGERDMRYIEPLALALGVDPEPAQNALREFEAALESLAGRNPEPWKAEISRAASRLKALRLDFEALSAARDADEAYWVEEFSNPHKAALRSIPLDMAAFGGRLRELFSSAIFISPSILLAQNDGRFFLQSLGLDGDPEKRVGLRRLAETDAPRFCMAPFTPAAAALDSAAAFAGFLAEAAGPFAAAGVFVLFPAQGAMRAAQRVLAAAFPGMPVWAQHADGGRDALARLYASGRGGFVLATEGQPGLRDAEGNSPALAVIARMPMPQFREPIWEARAERVSASGRNPRHDLWHPVAALRVKRELVPLRRDGGARVLWLLDARASADGLGALAGRVLGCEPFAAQNLGALRSETQKALGAAR